MNLKELLYLFVFLFARYFTNQVIVELKITIIRTIQNFFYNSYNVFELKLISFDT